MAAYTASVTGNWANTATWGGSGPPVNGDSITINTGITVTVAAGTTAACGTSPDNETTMDIIVNGTGKLLINGVLTCKGNVQISSGGTIEVVHTGGTAPEFVVDASHRPTTKRHHLRVGNAGTGRLIVTGLGPTQRAYVSGGTGATWYHNSTTAGQGQLDANYAYFTRMQHPGDAFQRCWLGGAISGTQKLDCSDSIFDDCGCFIFKADAGKTITWRRNRWINTSTNRPNVGDGGVAATAIVVFENNVLDKSPQLSGTALGNGGALRGSNNYANNGWGQSTGTGQWNWTIKENENGDFNLGPFQGAAATDVRYLEWLIQSDPAVTNPHITHLGGNRTCGGYIYQVHADGTGEGAIPLTADGITCTIRDVLLLPSSIGTQGGTIASFLANGGGAAANGETNIYNFTAVVGGSGSRGLMHGETNDSPTNTVRNFKNILAVDSASDLATSGGLIYLSLAQTSNDPVDATGVDHNWSHLVNQTTRALLYGGRHPGATGTQTTPTAANDIINVDPQMLDRSRRSEACAAWLGARLGATGNSTSTPGTAATQVNFRLLMKNMWTGEFFNVANADVQNACMLAIQWVTRGYIPRNSTGRGAGSDGKTPGYFSGWLPILTTPSMAGTAASCTANCADGTDYWVITQSATTPDWDRVLAGRDHTGAPVAAGFSGNQAAAGTSISIDTSGATLAPATNYYIHIARRAEGSEAGLDNYLRTSEPVTSAAFQGAAGGTGRFGVIRSPFRSTIQSPFSRRAA